MADSSGFLRRKSFNRFEVCFHVFVELSEEDLESGTNEKAISTVPTEKTVLNFFFFFFFKWN